MSLLPRPISDLVGRLTGRTRRVWSTEGRAHIEYRPGASSTCSTTASSPSSYRR
ncbi:hypothetical protein [Nitriliruptor alkaliphilus]|uniref:hypothetical protein n=1 Tax=Nitriliruptor alkaliphilus TaxID=427918 RepID=UPI0012ED6C1F|nr:hypothetical protein [Nitriliruptor alkaliphilus]